MRVRFARHFVAALIVYGVSQAWTVPALAGDDYMLGHGLDVGDFNIAGYSNVVLDAPMGRRKVLSLDDLSLYVAGHVNSWVNPFMEAELAGLPIFQTHDGNSGPRGRAVLERLYNDIIFSDSVTLRAGKMLTPVGEWNQIHAAPLVVTSSRPVSTFYSFSDYVTGASLLYTGASLPLPEIQVYWQPGTELAPRAPEMAPRQYRNIAGAHFNWPIGLTDKIGASVQHSTVTETGENQTLAGLNFNYKLGRFSIESEGTFTSIDRATGQSIRSNEWGAYLQGAYALTDTVSLYSWYEQYQSRTDNAISHDILAGGSWRPSPALAWKLEYLGSLAGPSAENRTGFYASFSVLF